MKDSQRNQALDAHKFYCEPTAAANGYWEIRHPQYDRPLAVIQNEYDAVGLVLTLREICEVYYDKGVEDGFDIGDNID